MNTLTLNIGNTISLLNDDMLVVPMHNQNPNINLDHQLPVNDPQTTEQETLLL